MSDNLYDVVLRDNTRSYNSGAYAGWGGDNVDIALIYPGSVVAESWLTVGDEFVRRLHKATGTYLAKKALNRG